MMSLGPLTLRKRSLLIRATDVAGLTRAFRPEPLRAEEMSEFYSGALDQCRASNLLRRIQDDLIESADQGFFFKGVLYGNRGVGKSTEINRLLSQPAVRDRFVIVRLDALEELNPQTFSVVDVLSLLIANLVEACEAKCAELKLPFHESGAMVNDLQQVLAPFFPEIQNRIQTGTTLGGGAEASFLSLIKLSLRAEGQRKIDVVANRETLAGLSAAIDRYVDVLNSRLPDYELLIVGENFDKEQIPQKLLVDSFVQYASLIRDLRIHLLLTLPVPFVYAYGDQLAFRRENRYPVYDIPVSSASYTDDLDGQNALKDLIGKRADYPNIFADEALLLLLRASGGDLYRLFALIVNSSRVARYRYEDDPTSARKILKPDVEKSVREQLGIFRNELGTSPQDPDDTSWDVKLQKLRAVYEGRPEANVPDKPLYQLLRKRAVLFFNGRGRYGVHPLAVEILREQLGGDPTFKYRGGGLDDPDL